MLLTVLNLLGQRASGRLFFLPLSNPIRISCEVLYYCRMLEDFEMELIFRQNFYDFFEEHRYNSDDGDLMYRMEAFDKATVCKLGYAFITLVIWYVHNSEQWNLTSNPKLSICPDHPNTKLMIIVH